MIKEKWKNFIVGIGLITIGTIIEVVWTGVLVYITSKIPYVGILIAILLGTMGIAFTICIINCGRIYYKDWKKRYSVVR